MRNRKIKLVTGVFSMLLCLSVYAQRPGGQGGAPGVQGERRGGGPGGGGNPRGERPDASEILSMLDTNDDDKISKEEASKARRGRMAEDFDEIDTNDDGFINLAELETALNARNSRRMSPEKLLKEVDANEDGVLDEKEVTSKKKYRQLSKNFKAIDKNNDGKIDLKELKNFMSKNKRKNAK